MPVARNPTVSFTKSANALGMVGVAVTAANVKSDGAGTIGTDMFLLLTAGTNDTYVQSVVWSATATAAATATTATTARLFLCAIGAGTPTATNCTCKGEVNLPSVSAANSTIPQPQFEIPFDDIVPAGYFLLVTNHVAPAVNSAWKAHCRYPGDY